MVKVWVSSGGYLILSEFGYEAFKEWCSANGVEHSQFFDDDEYMIDMSDHLYNPVVLGFLEDRFNTVSFSNILMFVNDDVSILEVEGEDYFDFFVPEWDDDVIIVVASSEGIKYVGEASAYEDYLYQY